MTGSGKEENQAPDLSLRTWTPEVSLVMVVVVVVVVMVVMVVVMVMVRVW